MASHSLANRPGSQRPSVSYDDRDWLRTLDTCLEDVLRRDQDERHARTASDRSSSRPSTAGTTTVSIQPSRRPSVESPLTSCPPTPDQSGLKRCAANELESECARKRRRLVSEVKRDHGNYENEAHCHDRKSVLCGTSVSLASAAAHISAVTSKPSKILRQHSFLTTTHPVAATSEHYAKSETTRNLGCAPALHPQSTPVSQKSVSAGIAVNNTLLAPRYSLLGIYQRAHRNAINIGHGIRTCRYLATLDPEDCRCACHVPAGIVHSFNFEPDNDVSPQEWWVQQVRDRERAKREWMHQRMAEQILMWN